MLLHELFEGMMKRSDAVVSGEIDTPPEPPTKSAHTTRIEHLAAKAKVSVDEVHQHWKEATKTVDPRLAHRWALVTQETKRRLGIK